MLSVHLSLAGSIVGACLVELGVEGRVRWEGGCVGADYGELECSCKGEYFLFYFLVAAQPAVQRANKRQ